MAAFIDLFLKIMDHHISVSACIQEIDSMTEIGGSWNILRVSLNGLEMMLCTWHYGKLII